jgi:hypothetical protein
MPSGTGDGVNRSADSDDQPTWLARITGRAIVDYPGENYLIDILAEFLAAGGAEIGVVGQARSELFRAVDLVRFATDWMNRNLLQSVNRADPTPIQ